MRIAVLSDVHGNLAALDAVLADISRRGIERVVGLGDFLSGPFDPRGVADRLMGLDLVAVRGNHDRWLFDGRPKNDWRIDAWVRGTVAPAQLDWLRSLPMTRVYEGEVFLCHGIPTDDNMFWMDAFTDDGRVESASRAHIEAAGAGVDYPVLLCGHTHVPRTLRLADGRLLVNPGSVGLPFMLGSPDARYAVIEKRASAWSVELVAIPYDRTPAQQQALALGEPGFAAAIETGWAKLSEL